MAQFALTLFSAAWKSLKIIVTIAGVFAWMLFWVIAFDCLAAMPFYNVCYP